MITVAEHTLDEKILIESREVPHVLNLGCRNFSFSDTLEEMGCVVYSVDCDPSIYPVGYFGFAVVGDSSIKRYIYRNNDPQATKVITTPTNEPVESKTIKELNSIFHVKFWDLIKMDIEGSEYEVIMSLTEAPAKQLSIEFHLHTGVYGESQVKEMEDKLLSLGYYPVKHDKYPAHGMSANYWDSLFILNEDIGKLYKTKL